MSLPRTEILTSDIYLCTFIPLSRILLSRVCVAPRALVLQQVVLQPKSSLTHCNVLRPVFNEPKARQVVFVSWCEFDAGFCYRYFPLDFRKKAGNGREHYKGVDYKLRADFNRIDLP